MGSGVTHALVDVDLDRGAGGRRRAQGRAPRQRAAPGGERCIRRMAFGLSSVASSLGYWAKTRRQPSAARVHLALAGLPGVEVEVDVLPARIARRAAARCRARPGATARQRPLRGRRPQRIVAGRPRPTAGGRPSWPVGVRLDVDPHLHVGGALDPAVGPPQPDQLGGQEAGLVGRQALGGAGGRPRLGRVSGRAAPRRAFAARRRAARPAR